MEVKELLSEVRTCHIVSNVVGVDVGSALELAARDTLLIASDGLVDNLKTEEIVG